MRKILRFVVMFILSGLIFGFVFSNSLNFSIDPILGSIYDNAKPEVRQNTIKNLRETCEVLDLISNRPDIIAEIDPSINKEKLIELCQKDLNDRELFVELLKFQLGDIDIQNIINQNSEFASYSSLFNLMPKSIIKNIILITVFTIFLFFIEENHLDFLKSINKILLTTSLLLFFVYLLPKIMGYFIDVDTSFLLDLDNTNRVIDTQEIILTLLPIILEEIFTDSLLFYAGFMFALYLIISAALFLIKRNKLISTNNNNTESQGP